MPRDGCYVYLKIQFPPKNDNTIHPIFVSEAVISRNTPVFVMEETREEKKKTTIPTFVVTFWLDSDKKKTLDADSRRRNITQPSLYCCGRDPPIVLHQRKPIPHHLLICLSSLLLLFCSSFWWCCSLSPSSFPSERRWYDSECKSSGVWLGRPFYIRVRVGMFYFFFFFLLLCFYFFFQSFLDAHTIHSFIHW